MIGWLKCKLWGHKRGKFVSQTATHKTFSCPRCGHKTIYKKKPGEL